MISFEPTDDQKMVRDSVAQFSERTLRPRIREFERARCSTRGRPARPRTPWDSRSPRFPRRSAASGLGLVTQVLIEEELAHGDPAAAFALSGPGAYGWASLLFGGPEIGKELIAPFFGDEASHPLRRRRLGRAQGAAAIVPAWRPLPSASVRAGGSRGEKSYVLHAERAESFIVFAQVDATKGWDGIGAFVVPATRPAARSSLASTRSGSTRRASEASRSMTSRCRRLRAFLTAPIAQRSASFFATQALLVAARAVGLARAAFEMTRDYCEQRKAFGKPIGHFQAVAFTLADRGMDLEAARAMVWRAALALGCGRRGGDGADERAALLHTAWAVSFALEAAMRAGDDAVQLHGGSGFMRDYPVEKWMRDAKQMQLCGMTAEHADQLAAALALGRPIDPALVLPSAESQNIFV